MARCVILCRKIRIELNRYGEGGIFRVRNRYSDRIEGMNGIDVVIFIRLF